MTTIEVTGKINKEQMERMQAFLGATIERLDEMTVNVTVEDVNCDDLTDWIDRQEEPYLTWRLV